MEREGLLNTVVRSLPGIPASQLACPARATKWCFWLRHEVCFQRTRLLRL